MAWEPWFKSVIVKDNETTEKPEKKISNPKEVKAIEDMRRKPDRVPTIVTDLDY